MLLMFSRGFKDIITKPAKFNEFPGLDYHVRIKLKIMQIDKKRNTSTHNTLMYVSASETWVFPLEQLSQLDCLQTV